MSHSARIRNAFAHAARSANTPVRASDSIQQTEPRFALHRDNATTALVSMLRVQFPVVEQLVGPEFFRAMAGDYVASEPPRPPVLLCDGDTFPEFIDAFAPAAPIPYLGDVARIEFARALACYTADVAPLDAAAFAELPPDRLGELRVRLHPSVSIVTSRHPAFSIWRVNQNLERVVPVSPWGPEAALIARPFLQVETRLLPAGAACFIQELAGGANMTEAFAAGAAVAPAFDARAAMALLITSDIVVGFESNVQPLRPD
jgi:Putative DNA-binding domain